MTDVILNAFNSGEISPDLYGRTDIQKVRYGAKIFENFILNIQGSAYFRGGFLYAGTIPSKGLTEDFTYNQNDTYTLVFGNKTLRFLRNKKFLTKEDGTILEISTPYLIEDLYDEIGLPALKKAQSSDVMYLLHKKYPPMRLERFSEKNFQLSVVDYGAEGGFEDLNNDENIRVYTSAQWGSVTLTATAPIFKNTHIGGLFHITPINFDGIYNWSEGRSVKIGQRVISDNKTYIATSDGTTGYSKPTHAEGTSTDGGVNWRFEDYGYGIAQITAVSQNGLTCTATVLNSIPFMAMGDTRKTWRWKFGSWCPEYGYPDTACFYRERLVLGRRKRIWISFSDDFESFKEREEGRLTTKCGFSMNVSSGLTTGNIKWILSSQNLLIGTDVNIISVGEETTSEVFYANNARSFAQTDDCCCSLAPIRLGQEFLFIQSSLTEMKELSPYNSLFYNSQSINQFSRHINVEGIIKIVRQREPFDIIYCLKKDGTLSCLMYNPQQEGLAWFRIKTDGFIESINIDGDVLCASIRRYIINSSGQKEERHTIEFLENPFFGFFDKTVADFKNETEYQEYVVQSLLEPQKKAVYLDSSVLIESASELSVINTNLDHLAGREVRILSDGGVEPMQKVSLINGKWSIVLQNKTKIAIIGLPYQGVIIPAKFELDTESMQFKKKRIHSVSFRLFNSMGGQFGSQMNNMYDILTRTGKNDLNNPVPLFSGDTENFSFPGDYGIDVPLIILQPYPLPFAIQAIKYSFI